MTSPWGQAESTAAQPIGMCPECGGMRYALLVHHCSTGVRMPPPLPKPSVPHDFIQTGLGGGTVTTKWLPDA